LKDAATGIEAPNDPQKLADAFRDAVVPKIRLCYSSLWNVLPVVAMQPIDPQDLTAPRHEWTSGTTVAGQYPASGDYLPRACVAVATVNTELVGRRARGRLFLGGGMTEADQANGVWTTLALGRWQAWLDAIPHQPDLTSEVSTFTVADWCIYSRTNRIADTGTYASKVINSVLHTQVHWLRSRSTVS
jgi:hypothetical protein